MDSTVRIEFSPPSPDYVISLTGLPGGGNRVYDRSAHGIHGTIHGAGWTRLPRGLWSLDFNVSDDYVDFGQSEAFDICTGITVRTWISITGNPSANYPAVLSERSNGNYRLIAGAVGDNTSLCFGIRDTSSTMRWSGYLDVGPGWHSVTGTFDGQAVSLYSDGDLKSQTAFSGMIDSPVNPGLFMANDAWNRYLRAMIALPSLCARALNEHEIRMRYEDEKELFI